MHTPQRRGPLVLAIAGLLLFSAPACAPVGDLLGDMGDIGGHPDGRSSVVTGELRSVDSRRGQLQVRDDRRRRNISIRFDQRTRVSDGQRQYPASSLRRGDEVRVSLSYDRSGNAWADRIDVRGASRGGPVTRTRVERVDGTVRTVDTRRGSFALDQGRGGALVVYLPARVSTGDARRFDRLRRGDRVRAEVRLYGNNQAELVRFR